ncbi:MAG: VanW family protein [Myxococcales bacterium]|nr:VanW family protein [Myxococcota bacterium]MDW8280355.1 VanW family protein [Myxococcales bacterium]
MDPCPSSTAANRHRRAVVSVALGILLVGLCGTAVALYLRTAPATLVGLRLAGEPLPSVSPEDLPARVRAVADRFLARPIRLRAGTEVVRASLQQAGFLVDVEQAAAAALRSGRSGHFLQDLVTRWRARRQGLDLPLPVRLDQTRAFDFLMEVKDEVDRSASDARLDLERHTVAPERPGQLLRVYDALVALEYVARSLSYGQTVPEVVLPVSAVWPSVRQADLQDIDVSTVLGSWETRYSSVESDRTYNLKIGADRLNGYILRPGELFSFNAVVGNRTEREGYRVAPVIQGGELIDGLAGGMCQIASTLHAAAFFAGLDIVRSTPHSRPSTYIPMGLDSTVVWPSVDLKLRNPYDFPVVLHYTVHQGVVKVEILGRRRPYHVAFEREILQETGFGTQLRPDPTMPAGQRLVEQDGYPGYRIKRRRYIFTGRWRLDPKQGNRPAPEGLVSSKEWDLFYPPTTQIIRVGTGPTSLKKKEPFPSHRIPPVPARDKPFLYLVR